MRRRALGLVALLAILVSAIATVHRMRTSRNYKPRNQVAKLARTALTAAEEELLHAEDDSLKFEFSQAVAKYDARKFREAVHTPAELAFADVVDLVIQEAASCRQQMQDASLKDRLRIKPCAERVERLERVHAKEIASLGGSAAAK